MVKIIGYNEDAMSDQVAPPPPATDEVHPPTSGQQASASAAAPVTGQQSGGVADIDSNWKAINDRLTQFEANVYSRLDALKPKTEPPAKPPEPTVKERLEKLRQSLPKTATTKPTRRRAFNWKGK